MSFAEDGYEIVKGVLSSEDLEPLRRVITREVERHTNELYEQGKITDKFVDLPLSTRWAEVCKMHKQKAFGWNNEVFSKEIYDLYANPRLLDYVETIIGPEVQVNGDFSVRPKLPNEDWTTLPWHQDGHYYGGKDASSKDFTILSVWVPLVDVDETNGCLQVIPGSHQWGLFSNYVKTSIGHMACAEDVEARGKAVSAVMKAGDLLVFDQFMFHRSLPNRSNEIRWSIDLRYSPADQPYTWHGNPNYDKICPCFVARSKTKPVTAWEDWYERFVQRMF